MGGANLEMFYLLFPEIMICCHMKKGAKTVNTNKIKNETITKDSCGNIE